MIQTVVSLKKKPECSMLCCLELLQLVGDAHGEMSGVCAQPSMTEDSLRNGVSELPTVQDDASKVELANIADPADEDYTCKNKLQPKSEVDPGLE
jgi:hypothetical protein